MRCLAIATTADAPAGGLRARPAGVRRALVACAGLLIALIAGCGEPAGASSPAVQPAPAPATGPGPAPAPMEAAQPVPPLAPVGIWLDEQPYLRGHAALAEAVAALSTNIRVLHVGAHPDDEMSDLVAYLARGRHFQTAYLSANRGEGGQNGIGPEKGYALGVIRTEELLAARRIDGAQQYFLSVPDFGFSKSAAETFKIWGKEKTLRELVHFIRWYRPQVIVSVFSGTPLDGHGHHQAIGQLTRLAFDAAADPTFKDDLPPWTTQLLFQSMWMDPGPAVLPGQRFTIDAGEYDPLLGKTYHQMAMDGRSQHRTQDMGAAQTPGPHPIVLRLWAQHAVPKYLLALDYGQGGELRPNPADPFATVMGAVPQESLAFSMPPSPDQWMVRSLQMIGDSAAQLLMEGQHANLVNTLADGVSMARDDAAEMERRSREHAVAPVKDVPGDSPRFDPWAELAEVYNNVEQKYERAEWLASGVDFEVRCDRRFYTPGQAGTLTVRFIGRSDASIVDPTVEFDHAQAWKIVLTGHADPAPTMAGAVPARPSPPATEEWTWTFSFTVPEDAALTQPEYLPIAWAETARFGNRYQATMDLPPIVAHMTYGMGEAGHANKATEQTDPVGGKHGPATTIRVSTSGQYVWTDPGFGERREMVKVVPPISVAFSRPVLAVTKTAAGVVVPPETVTVTNLSDQSAAGGILIFPKPPGDRSQPDAIMRPEMVELKLRGASTSFTIQDELKKMTTIPSDLSVWTAEFDDDVPGYVNFPSFEAMTLTRVDYPHIRPHNLYAPAACKILTLDRTLPKGLKVGYISGPGTDDDLIDALRQMDARLEVLDEDTLPKADLASFDTIFVGVRAYEVRKDLLPFNDRLLNYVKNGGTLIVMYEKNVSATVTWAPAPIAYTNPADRVTEEDAPVTFLKPDALLLNQPYKLTPADFQGWFQDKGLYFFAEQGRDPGYEALLSCHDTGEPPKTGGLLDYKLGAGHWVYCGYALHLQIPKAVPGAWRMLANLASYGRLARPPEKP